MRAVEEASLKNRALGLLGRRLSWTGRGIIAAMVLCLIAVLAVTLLAHFQYEDAARGRREDAKAFADRISATVAKDVDEAMRMTPGCRMGCAKYDLQANHWRWETASDISAQVVELMAWPRSKQRPESFRLIIYAFYTKPPETPGLYSFTQTESSLELHRKFLEHVNDRNGNEQPVGDNGPITVPWPFPGKERMKSQNIYANILRYGPFNEPRSWREDLPEHEPK